MCNVTFRTHTFHNPPSFILTGDRPRSGSMSMEQPSFPGIRGLTLLSDRHTQSPMTSDGSPQGVDRSSKEGGSGKMSRQSIGSGSSFPPALEVRWEWGGAESRTRGSGSCHQHRGYRGGSGEGEHGRTATSVRHKSTGRTAGDAAMLPSGRFQS